MKVSMEENLWNGIDRGTEILEEKPVSVPRFLPSISGVLFWDRTAPSRLEAGAPKEEN
jgi:hypothetical protein